MTVKETKTNWQDLVHPAIVEFMPKTANYVNGIPNIAAITRAGIFADKSGKYDNPRIFTNDEIQRQVSLLHPSGTTKACINWYRNNPGQRKTTPRIMFREAYKLFKENGNSIPPEDLAAIAEANLHVIFSARGADLTVLSKYPIVENYKKAEQVRIKKSRAEICAKARAVAKMNAAKRLAEKAAVEVTETNATVEKINPPVIENDAPKIETKDKKMKLKKKI